MNAEDLKPVGGGVGEVVRWSVDEGVGLEAEGAANAVSAAAAGGEDVGVGVADHDGFGWRDRDTGDGAGFGDENLEAVWVGFFCVEAITTVVLKEEAREAEVGAYVAGGIDWFVGEDGHQDSGMVGVDGFQ